MKNMYEHNGTHSVKSQIKNHPILRQKLVWKSIDKLVIPEHHDSRQGDSFFRVTKT